MSRTRRNEPSSKIWLRRPSHHRAAKQAAEVHDELGPEVRAKVPPSNWDDIPVSTWRGQKWARRK